MVVGHDQDGTNVGTDPVAPYLPPGGAPWDETLCLMAADGIRLRGAIWRGAGDRGLALLLTGRTEFLEKASIPAAELVARGFSVASVDWRGQGESDRLLDNPLKGHVDSFESYHRDLDALIEHPSVAVFTGPRIVVAHSMGGTIGIGAMLRDRLHADAVILSAPMLGVSMSRVTRVFSNVVVWLAKRLGRLNRWPPVVEVDQPYVFSGFDGNVLTGDRSVFDWMVDALRRNPGLQLAMPTIGWMDAATRETEWIAAQGSLPKPALCLLGSEEDVVDVGAIRAGVPRLGAELVELEGARHEVLIETPVLRAQAWKAIDAFLDRVGV